MKITKLFIKSLIALLLVLSQAQAASKTVFYHHDALGSIVSSTDENGEVLWNEEYRKRKTNPSTTSKAITLNYFKSTFQGNNASISSTVIALGSSLKI